ncbi:MAG: ribonuclease III [Lachnospiraceae bacterium]|nr:ribonuclease III [Lachnospiraceae bacterium]
MLNREEEAVLSLENAIAYVFKDKSLAVTALMHSSYSNEHNYSSIDNNERLEFLGDAVLELISSEHIFKNLKDSHEGEMSRTRASYVCEQTLALCAREFHLEQFILLGKGEEITGGRQRDSIVSDALEAVIGAIYLDGGFTSAKEFIHKFVLEDIENKKLFYDSKTTLQEMIQENSGKTVRYKLLSQEGPDHDKTFTSAVVINDEVFTTGIGKSKKLSEQKAAYQAILKLKEVKKRD